MSDIVAVLGQLDAPGSTLVFCDETDITQGQAAPTIVANVHMRAALFMPSEKYAAAALAIRGRCIALGVSELHAAEIVNPGKHSAWKPLSMADRIGALKLACDLVVSCADRIGFVHVPKHQYAEFYAADTTGEMPANYKAGVKRVFLRVLAEQTLGVPGPIIVMDQEQPGQPTLAAVEHGAHLAAGGAILADSALVEGLQLADIAAYAIGRYPRRKAKMDKEELDPFDTIILQTVASLEGRVETML